MMLIPIEDTLQERIGTTTFKKIRKHKRRLGSAVNSIDDVVDMWVFKLFINNIIFFLSGYMTVSKYSISCAQSTIVRFFLTLVWR